VALVLVCSAACAAPLRTLYRETVATPWEASKYVPSERTDCEYGLTLLAGRAAEMGIQVFYVALPENMVGVFNRDEKAIAVREELTVCGRLEVLAHELGHALSPPVIMGTPEGQVFADGVSYLVVRKLAGYDPVHTYAAYLAGLKVAAPTLLLYQQDIERAATWLVEGK
jgi:hypothetical protein